MTANRDDHNPTGQQVLDLYARADDLVASGRSAGIYGEFQPFYVAARVYKFAHLKRKKGADQADDDDAHHDGVEDAHLQVAIKTYPPALAAVERGEATARAVAQIPAQGAVRDEAGSTDQGPAAGEPVLRDVAALDARAPCEVRLVRIKEVLVPTKRMRQLGKIEQLVESIRELGLLEPIILRRETKELISGLHRLESIRALGQDEILARLVDVTDLQVEMMELDENLARVELTALERAEHIIRRKQLYEALHPEVKHGGAPGKPGGGKAKAKGARVASFAADTAKKTGLSQRTIQEDVQVAKLSPEARRLVKGTPLENKKRELLALARLPQEEQAAVARTVTSGKVTTVAEAAQKSGSKRKSKAGPTLVKAKSVTQRPLHAAAGIGTVAPLAKPCWNCGASDADSFAVTGAQKALPCGKVVEVPFEAEEVRQVKAVEHFIASARAMTAELEKLPSEIGDERSRLLQEVVDVITNGFRKLDKILSPMLARGLTAA